VNRTVAAVLLFTIALGAQVPTPKPDAAPAPASGTPMDAPRSAKASEPEPPSDQVLAHLGKRRIVYGEFAKWLKATAGPRLDMIRKDPGTRNAAIQQYLELRVLEAKARAANLQKTPAYKELQALQAQQSLVRVLLDEERVGGDGWELKQKAGNPTEAELLAHYQKTKDRYATPERFTARHIFVSFQGSLSGIAPGRSDDEAMKIITRIQAELKAGKTLEALASEYSDDPGTKANGGLCQDSTFGRFAGEFDAAVRAQDLGKVGAPVKTPYGYHLIEVLSMSPRQEAEFAKVREAVKNQMIPERRNRLKQDYLEAAKKAVGFRAAGESAKASSATASAGRPKPKAAQ
jgi:PPIC-type PPIASE domain